MEYLSSGTPVVAYMLDGMLEEYREYIYPISDVEDGLYKTLKEVLCIEEKELYNKGQRAKYFVLTLKSGSV